jgi:hypothetical protein
VPSCKAMRDLPRWRRRLRIPPFVGLGSAFVVAACRFSGSATDPYAEAPLSASGGNGGKDTGGSADTGGTGDTGSTDENGGTSDTGSNSDTGGTSDSGGTRGTGGAKSTTGGRTAIDSGTGASAGKEAGTAGSEGGISPTPGGCQPATVPAICDPVKNLGCLVPFSSCDIDTTQVIATGRCVFPWSSAPPPVDAGSCFEDTTTDTCAATSTCVNGTCRKLCYCDSDCEAGECCSEPAPGPSTAFKLCKPC